MSEKRKFTDRPETKWALLSSEDRLNDSLCIFIHGFYGNYLSTWGKIPQLLRSHADQDQACKEWDFLFVGYATGNVESYLDISKIIVTEWRKARNGEAPYRTRYKRFTLVGHSLGTLGIRQLLCAQALQPDGTIRDLKSVLLFGTPLSGSSLAKYAIWSSIGSALKDNNPQMRMLRVWTQSTVENIKWPPVRVILGLDDKVVGATKAELIKWEGDVDPVDVNNLDHGTLVKPNHWNSLVINYLQNALA